jgi:hypothetical protein
VRKEVAPQTQVERLTDLALEALQPANRLQSDADVELVGEEGAHAAGAVAGRAGTERLALQQQRPLAAAISEVVQRSRADDPAADDDGTPLRQHRSDEATPTVRAEASAPAPRPCFL